MKIKLISLQVILVLIAGSSIYGQAGKIFTEADYKRAVEMLYGNVARFIDNDIQPQWLQDNRLWYCVKSGSKVEYRMFNPANGKILVAGSEKELMEKATVSQEEVKTMANEVLSPDGQYR